MKIKIVAAISKDEFLTRGDELDVSAWTSKEDKDFFLKIKSEHSFYIMGSKTYESLNIKPQPGVLRIVMTRRPEKYDDSIVPGQIEFTDMSPLEIIAKYQTLYDACLLLGGGEIYEEFLKQNLVDEIYLTVEPIMHGSGTPLLASGEKLSMFLDGVEPTVEDLNSAGTKLLRYLIK